MPYRQARSGGYHVALQWLAWLTHFSVVIPKHGSLLIGTQKSFGVKR